MFIYPLFRLNGVKSPGISFMLQGSEIASNPAISVTFVDANNNSFDLVVKKQMIGAAMFVQATPQPGVVVASGLGTDGGVGSITVTVTGTTQQITADVGYGEPGVGGVGVPPGPPA